MEMYDEAYKTYIRNCLRILRDKLRSMGQAVPTIGKVNILRLVRAVDAYIEADGMTFRKNYEYEYKLKVITDEWDTLTS